MHRRNTVFSVDDEGTVSAFKLGMGTSNPQAPLHLNLPDQLGVTPDAGTALYNVSTGFALSTYNNSPAFDMTTADDQGIGGYRGAIRGVRARGTLANPLAAGAEDKVLSVLAGVYDGTSVLNNADMSYIVDGPVSTGVAPVRISFRQKLGGSGPWVETMTIKSNGNVGIGETNPTSHLQVAGLPVYADNATATAAGLTPGAFYRTSAGVLMVVY